MKLKFIKPLVPNFVRTNQCTLPLKDLSDEEIEEYIQLWTNTLKERRQKQFEIFK